jgi:hypothetical protein
MSARLGVMACARRWQAARVEINRALVLRCYHDAEAAVLDAYQPDAVEQLVWHVAAHEVRDWMGTMVGVASRHSGRMVWPRPVRAMPCPQVGHAIYNLASVASCFSRPANVSLLEEPRAELTAMFTLRLLHQQGMLTA